MRQKMAALVGAVVVAGLGASAAFAGEVKGPPTGGKAATNFNTAATDHANSVCVFSGLNDFINGQSRSRRRHPRTLRLGPPATVSMACSRSVAGAAATPITHRRNGSRQHVAPCDWREGADEAPSLGSIRLRLFQAPGVCTGVCTARARIEILRPMWPAQAWVKTAWRGARSRDG